MGSAASVSVCSGSNIYGIPKATCRACDVGKPTAETVAEAAKVHRVNELCPRSPYNA